MQDTALVIPTSWAASVPKPLKPGSEVQISLNQRGFLNRGSELSSIPRTAVRGKRFARRGPRSGSREEPQQLLPLPARAACRRPTELRFPECRAGGNAKRSELSPAGRGSSRRGRLSGGDGGGRAGRAQVVPLPGRGWARRRPAAVGAARRGRRGPAMDEQAGPGVFFSNNNNNNALLLPPPTGGPGLEPGEAAAAAAAAAAGGGSGGVSAGGTAAPVSASRAQYSVPGILHFLQHEWGRFEAERAEWEAERAELQVTSPPWPPPRAPLRPRPTGGAPPTGPGSSPPLGGA